MEQRARDGETRHDFAKDSPLVIYVVHVARPRESGTKFTFSSNVTPPSAICLVASRKRAVEEPFQRHCSLSWRKDFGDITPSPNPRANLVHRYREWAFLRVLDTWTSLIASTLLLAHVRNSNLGLSAFSLDVCFASFRKNDASRANLPRFRAFELDRGCNVWFHPFSLSD